VRKLIIAALSLLCLPAFASQNHVVNSTFGTGISGWPQYAYAGHTLGWASGVGHAAAGSAYVYVDGTQDGSPHDVYRQCIGVKELTPYSFGVWFRYDDGGYDTAGRGNINVSFFSGADCSIGGYIAASGSSGSQTGASYVNTFQQLSLTGGNVPPNAHSALVGLRFYTTNVGTAVGYFDDVTFNNGLSGDANADGSRSVSDVFYLINFLFAGGPAPQG